MSATTGLICSYLYKHKEFFRKDVYDPEVIKFLLRSGQYADFKRVKLIRKEIIEVKAEKQIQERCWNIIKLQLNHERIPNEFKTKNNFKIRPKTKVSWIPPRILQDIVKYM
jgi:hypothetical protein